MKPYRSPWPSGDHAPSTTNPRCHVVDSDPHAPTSRRLAVSERETVHLVPLESILWISAAAGRLCVHHASGELTADGVLNALTKALGSGFQRINRNTTVNMAAVSEIRRRSRRGESAVVLSDGRQLPVTRLYTPALRAWLLGRRSTLDSQLNGRTSASGATP